MGIVCQLKLHILTIVFSDETDCDNSNNTQVTGLTNTIKWLRPKKKKQNYICQLAICSILACT